MLRHLLATTAIAAVLSTGALAADNETMNADKNVTEQPAAGVMEFELHTLAPDATTGILASNMIGKSIKTGETDDAEEIGDINDVVINRDGEVRAVIVGVGGFLGIGEKDVAVDFSRLTFVADAEDDDELVIATDVTREELENATAYERPENMPQWMTTAAIRDEMDKISDSAKDTYNAVRNEAVDPAKKQDEQAMNSGDTAETNVDQAMSSDDTADDTWNSENTRVDTATVSTEALIGATVYVGQDTDIGEVSQVLIGDDNKAKAVVIDVGGFLGFGDKPVAVSYDSLNMFETENGDLLITAPFTKEELENAPEFEPAAYKDSPDSVLLKG